MSHLVVIFSLAIVMLFAAIASAQVTASSSNASSATVVEQKDAGTTNSESVSQNGSEKSQPALSTEELSREERIRAHQEKINKIIEENRQKQQAEAQKAAAHGTPVPAPAPYAGVYLQDKTTSLPAHASTKVKASFADAPIARIVSALSRSSGQPMTAVGTAADIRVSLMVRDVELKNALDLIINSDPRLLWDYDEQYGYRIWTQSEYQRLRKMKSILPPPLPAGGPLDRNISVSFSDAPLQRVLQYVTEETSIPVVARGRSAQMRVTSIGHDITVRQVLNEVAAAERLVVDQSSDQIGVWEVWDLRSYYDEVLPRRAKQKVWAVSLAQAKQIAEGLQPLLTEGIGSAVADEKYNKIMVTDLPTALDKAEQYIRSIDDTAVEVK